MEAISLQFSIVANSGCAQTNASVLPQDTCSDRLAPHDKGCSLYRAWLEGMSNSCIAGLLQPHFVGYPVENAFRTFIAGVSFTVVVTTNPNRGANAPIGQAPAG
jgi:hypothetical protein